MNFNENTQPADNDKAHWCDAMQIPTPLGAVAFPRLLVAALEGGAPPHVIIQAWTAVWPKDFHPLLAPLAVAVLSDAVEQARAASNVNPN